MEGLSRGQEEGSAARGVLLSQLIQDLTGLVLQGLWGGRPLFPEGKCCFPGSHVPCLSRATSLSLELRPDSVQRRPRE